MSLCNRSNSKRHFSLDFDVAQDFPDGAKVVVVPDGTIQYLV